MCAKIEKDTDCLRARPSEICEDKPNHKPDFKPDYRPDYKPDCKPEMKPEPRNA